MPRPRKTSKPTAKPTDSYQHPESESLMRPEVGTQPQFKKKLPPQKYRYDDSVSPVLEWDSQNPARERGEAHLAAAESELAAATQRCVALDGMLKATQPSTSMIAEQARSVRQHLATAQSAVQQFKAMSKPFLNWSGKAERLSFDVPTLPLFIHERLSTKAILETLKGHKRDQQTDMYEARSSPTFVPRLASLLRNSCRPLKRTRFIPLCLPRHLRAGLSCTAAPRLEHRLSHRHCFPSSFVTASCAVGCILAPLRG